MRIRHKRALLLSAPFWLLCLAQASCARPGRTSAPRDKGGTYLILGVKSEPARLESDVEQTMAVMRKRCEDLNVYCALERLGGANPERIKLRFSAVVDPERVKAVLLSQGMELREVISPKSPYPVQVYTTQAEAEAAAGKDKDVLPYAEDKDKGFMVLERAPIVTGQDVVEAEAVPDFSESERYQITFKLNQAGASRFGEWTGSHIDSYLAIVLNRQVRSTAFIKGQIYDSGQITGMFKKEQAEDIALVLRSGNLPAPVEALEEGTYRSQQESPN